ncbi:MAG: carboxylate-amine ligase, partial [Rhodospirillaceae bacterium]|nr:carboxylate-amine ligase [Rhodospirillaceae bacterium]
TGLPEPIASWSEYQRMIQHMTSSGRIHDGSKIWWDLRPSSHYPTLEMRICDVCPDMEGALTVAALFQCILRMLYRLRIGNQRWREYPNMLVQENRWLAQRYGSSSELVDFGKRSLVPLADLIDEVLELTAEDAEALGCTAEVQRARLIVQRGTAAERQLSVFEAAGGAAAGDDAFRAVVLDLVEQTAAGTS